MKIEYRTGNLFDGEDVRFVTHCCNAQKKMRSGFAKELRERYPDAYEAYMREPTLTLGQIIPYAAPDSRMIFNLVGQKNYGRDAKRYASYDAIASGLEALDEAAPDLGMAKLFMPLIGAGLAGGSWRVISAIIETHSTNYRPIVYLLDGIIPST